MNNPLADGKRIKLGFDYFSTGYSPSQLSEAYYLLCANRQQERLLFETATLCEVEEVYNPGDENDRMTTEEMVMEAIRIQKFSRTDSKMAALVRVFNGFLADKNIEALAPIVGNPKKAGLFATVTVQIPFSDGQVVSIIFHSPDNNKMKIAADDEIIAFRWLLNKRDVTHVVSPEGDAEVSLQEIGKRTAQLVKKNSARFQTMQKDLVEQKKKLEDTKALADEAIKQHDVLMATLKDTQDAVEMADTKIVNLKDRIEKQKAFNDDLRGKIDALKAQQAGNDGKAVGGETPKDEAAMKAEQEQKAFEDKKAEFAQALKGRGWVQGSQIDDWHLSLSPTGDLDDVGDVWNFGYDSEKPYSAKVVIGTRKIETITKIFSSSTIAGMDKQATEALAFIDKKIAEIKGNDEGKQQFIDIANSDEVVTMSQADYESFLKKYKINVGGPAEPSWAWAIRARLEEVGITDQRVLAQKFLDLYEKATDEARAYVRIGLAYAIEKIPDYEKNPSLVEIKNKVTNFYSSVESLIKEIAADGGNDKTGEQATEPWQMTKAEFLQRAKNSLSSEELLKDQWVKNFLGNVEISHRNKVKLAIKEGEDIPPEVLKDYPDLLAQTKPDGPAAVSVLNDILAGKYDDDLTKLGEALDQAATDLEREGKLEEYDALLNQCADKLTDLLKKEAA